MIGIILSPHGVRGTLRVKATGDGRHLREGMSPVVGGERRGIQRSRETPKGFLIDFEGLSSRYEANRFRGETLSLERRELDEPEPDEFYVSDLIGLIATNESGESIGAVSDVVEAPGQDTLVIRNGDEELLVPFVAKYVPEVDLEHGLTVRPPDGE